MGEREIVLTGGSPWGMRLSGGKDFGSPLAVSRVTPGSKSKLAGVEDNDFILSINGQNCKDMKHMEAQNTIKRAGDTLKLTVTQTRPKWAGVEITGNVSATSSLVPSTQPTVATYYNAPPSTTPSTTPSKTTPSATPSRTAYISSPGAPLYKFTSPPEQLSVSNTEAVDTGLEHGSTFQSPSYSRIMMGNEVPFGHTSVAAGVQKRTPTQPTPPPAQPTPPTQQLRNIRLEDKGVVKTSEKPAGFTSGIVPTPPSGGKASATPANVPKPSKPMFTPTPPPPAQAATRPAPPPATPPGRSGVDGTTSPLAGKLSTRQTECEKCKEVIRGPYVGALGKFWHPEHFACSKCLKPLSNQTFVMEGEDAFCEPCYAKSVAPTCENCRQPITGAYVTAINRFWHQEHFLCFKCKRRIATDEGFSFDNNHVYCTACYSEQHGVSCAGCKKSIGADELWVEALEKNWHPQCFVCETCRTPLEGGTFFVKMGRPYCSKHR